MKQYFCDFSIFIYLHTFWEAMIFIHVIREITLAVLANMRFLSIDRSERNCDLCDKE